MPKTEVVPLGAAIASDVLSAFNLPGGATLEHAATRWVEKKQRESAALLIKEITSGFHGHIDWEAHDVDPLIEIVFRFTKAVEEGAARENLRLLAMVIAGLKKHRTLDPDQFRKWAGVLEQLSRDELMVLGTAHVIRKRLTAAGPTDQPTFWQELRNTLKRKGYSDVVVLALCASLSRTGLLVPMGAFGGVIYCDSDWLEELGTLAELEPLA